MVVMVQIVDIPQQGGFFAPANYQDAHAILVEVVNLERQRPGGNFGPKDTIHANLTVFHQEGDIESGNVEEVAGVMIQQTALVRDLTQLVGKGTVVRVTQKPSSKPGQGPAWVWQRVPATVTAQVVAYAEKREAAVEEAKAAMPSFLS